MMENNRKHIRIEKHLTMQFCVVDDFPQKWDMSNIDNISVGGIKFTVSSSLNLNNKTIKLQIMMPELAPKILEVHALVLSAIKRPNTNVLDVRCKFVYLSEADKVNLSLIEKIIEWHEHKKK